MVGMTLLDMFVSNLEFLNEIQSISGIYDDIGIDLEELPADDSIYWANEFDWD